MSYRESHKNQWENYEKMYLKKYDNFVWKLEQEVLKKILKKKEKNIKVMDFACWTGRISKFLEFYFDNIDWIDISNNMLDIARAKTSKVKYYLGDITNNTFNLEKKYDLITTFRFFLNAEQKLREDWLKSLYKYLNKDSLLIFSNHWNKFSLRSIKVFLKKIIWIKKWNNELSHKEINNLLNSNWFKIIKIYPISFLPQFLYKLFSYNLIKKIEKKLQNVNFLKLYAVDIIYIVKKIDE